jgi:hypothetical protein
VWNQHQPSRRPEGERGQLGGALGAKDLISVTVQASGDSMTVSGVVEDVSGAKAISRASSVFKCGNLEQGIQQFAQQLVAGMSGSGAPQCASGWQGTVQVSTTSQGQGLTGGGAKYTVGASSNLSCQLTGAVTGAGQVAKCSYSANGGGEGPLASMRTTIASTDATTWVSAGIAGGKLSLHIGKIPARVFTEASGVPVHLDPTDTTIDGGSFDDLPASSNPNSQSGSWSKTVGGTTTTVNWSLTRK